MELIHLFLPRHSASVFLALRVLILKFSMDIFPMNLWISAYEWPAPSIERIIWSVSLCLLRHFIKSLCSNCATWFPFIDNSWPTSSREILFFCFLRESINAFFNIFFAYAYGYSAFKNFCWFSISLINVCWQRSSAMLKSFVNVRA